MEPVLELKNVSRRISSEFSLRNISFALQKGQVGALVGKNAAGKSSLTQVLMGLSPLDSGEICLDGNAVSISSPALATSLGIVLLGQNVQLFPRLSVMDNVYFGQELYKKGLLKTLDNKEMNRRTAQLLAEMNLDVSPKTPVSALGTAQQQIVALMRAIISRAKVILLDEPSTHLAPPEKKMLYRAICGMKEQGTSLLLITHDLDEVLEIADVVFVLERGALVETLPVKVATRSHLTEVITGESYANYYCKANVPAGKLLLEIAQPAICLHEGEIVGYMAQEGDFLERLARYLGGFGPESYFFAGANRQIEGPADAMQAGICLCMTEAAEKMLTRYSKELEKGTNTKGAKRLADMKDTLSGMGDTLSHVVGVNAKKGVYTTGGNRQRELVERAMAKKAAVTILLEPTAGMDALAKKHFYAALHDGVCEGRAYLLLTSDKEEATALCDRIGGLAKER